MFLIFVAIYQRRNPTYTLFAVVGSLLKFLVTFGITYWLYFCGTNIRNYCCYIYNYGL
ncbi:MAG: hypothetical protein L6U99_09035 [Clostridium sp.]|nr:MAG: hypothetical protein L6U99_09035 [Clostridium sp.]